MKILIKCLWKLLLLSFYMCIFYFGVKFSMTAVVNLWAFEFKDTFYEFNKNGIALYIGSISLILGIFLYLSYATQKYISNRLFLLFAIMAGITIFIFTIDKWINWLEILFNEYQLYDYNEIEIGFENSFGNNTKAQNLITSAIVVSFTFNMLFKNIEIVLKSKPYVKEAFANKDDMTDIIITGLATYLFWPALSTKLFSRLSNLIVLVTIAFIELLYFTINIVIWRRMIKFSVSNERNAVYIVVTEIGKGHFLHYLFKKEFKFIKQLYYEQIILVSKNEYLHFYKSEKNIISLECYMTFDIKESEIQRNHLKDAIFHIAYCCEYFWNFQKLDISLYEEIIKESSIKSAIQQIVPYCNKVFYKRSLEEKLQNNQTLEMKNRNLFEYSYVEMNKYLQNELDTFQSFKILLNMLEMLNYFYTIILVSYQEYSVLTLINRQPDKLTNATFGSWIKLREFLSGKKQMNQILHNSYAYEKCKYFKTMMENELCDYYLFAQLYQLMDIKVQNSNKIDSKFNLSSSFKMMRDFRNDTRGHGVYTFEITEELNLSLIEIIQCWFYKLYKYGFLEEDYNNLVQLGWILKYKKKAYYFYSYNKKANQLEYFCFLDGTVLYMPYDSIS